MNTAIVELNALPDPIGSAAQNHHLAALVGFRLVLTFVGGIQVRRERLELGTAGIDGLVYRRHFKCVAGLRDLRFLGAAQIRDPAVGKSERLEFSEIGLT